MPSVQQHPAADAVAVLKRKLLLEGTTLPAKYRILFSLRNVPGREAQEALEAGLKDSSALFRHDVAFCLGQRQEAGATEILVGVLADMSEHPMVRHEAAEALGAIATPECMETLEKFRGDSRREVSETCSLALQRIEYFRERQEMGDSEKRGCGNDSSQESPYLSVDPTPAAPVSTPTCELRETLLDEKAPMFDRYAALFALRNQGGAVPIAAIGAAFQSGSALLKHEVAYVLGQMQDPDALSHLMEVLRDGKEHAMVRHEAAEALGAIGQEACVALLREFSTDPEPIVAESCIVALDVLEHNASGEFQYADLGVSEVS